MKTIRYAQYGGPEVLELVTVEPPVAGPGEVRVRLRAAGVSPIDAKLRAGLLKQHFTLTFPKVPGRDGMGVIDQVGAGVSDFRVGDPVCVVADPTGAGTYAEAIVCAAERVVRKPSTLTDAQAAALLQPGASAWIPVMQTADVKPGMRVLVHGGAGSVGGLMVQLLNHLGTHVIATCRADNLDYVRALGAQEAIAYDRDDFGRLREIDIVFDLIGGEVHARSYPVLRRGGQLVYLTAAPIVDRGNEFGVRVARSMISDMPEALRAVAELAEANVLRPNVAGIFALEKAADAHRAFEAGQVTRGRLLLDVDLRGD